MEARILAQTEHPLWDELVSSSPYGSVFDESRWFTAVADVFGRTVEVVGVFDDDRLAGGVVLECSKRCGLPVGALPPLCHTNTCVVDVDPAALPSKRHTQLLTVSGVLARFLHEQFDFVVVTNHCLMNDVRGFRWQGWRTNVLYTFLLDLTAASLERMSRKKRQAIRRAERAGITVVDDASPDVVYALLCKSSERQGIAPPVTDQQLAAMRERVGPAFRMRVAVHPQQDRPLAALVSAHDESRATIYALLAGFDPEFADTHAASYLHWTEMVACRDLGAKTFDYMGADVESNVRFKAQFGCEVVPYFQVSQVSRRYRIVNALLP